MHSQSASFRWIRQIGGSGAQTLAGVATDPQGNIYAAGTTTSLDFPVQNAVQARPAGSGLFRIDGPGSNWANLYAAGAAATNVVAVDPRNPRTVYAATNTDILRSTDSGATWTDLGNVGATVITGLAIDSVNSGTLYLTTVGRGILKSTDAGVTWNSATGNLPQTPGSVPSARNIWVDPNHPSVLFVVTATNSYFLARSGDGGNTWQVLQNTPVPINGSVTFDPLTPGKVYVADGSTSAVSTDDGVTWSYLASTGVTYSEPWVILPGPGHSGVLYAGAQDAVWKSTNGGASWIRQITAPASLLALDPTTGVIYAADKFGTSVVMTADFFQTAIPAGPAGIPQITSLAAGAGHAFAGASASSDVFVAKFDPRGNVLFATYFGGSSTDTAHAIAVDAGGGVYVTGSTGSLDFPISAGAYGKTPGPGFIFKLNPDGSLAWSTYFGGAPNAMAVDGGGHVFVAGTIGIPSNVVGQTLGFQTTAGAYQPKFDGVFCGIGCLISIPPTNGFLTEFDSVGSSLIYSTYLGTQNEIGNAVTVLPDGSAVFAGNQLLYHLNAAGSSLLGKKSILAEMRSLTTDPSGNILLAGGTQNTSFQTTPGAFQPSPYPGLLLPGTEGNNGPGDAVVMRLDPQWNVVASTLLGGEANDVAISVAATADGSVVAGGSTNSRAFPTRGPIQNSFSPATGFLSQLTPDLSTLSFSTFAGDNRIFYIRSIAAMPGGGIVFGGSTAPAPYFSNDNLQPGNNSEAFLVRTDVLQPAVPRIDSVVNAASQLGVPLSPGETIQVHGSGFAGDAVLLLNGAALPLLDRSATTLTATLPPDFASVSSTLEVDSGGSHATILLAGAAASPGVFSTDGSGIGQGYILNKDGALNSRDNPAKEGDEITVYATGVGAMTFTQGYAVTNASVDVLVDGFLAPGIAAVLNPAAGLPGNVYQISVYVPRPSDYASSNPNLQGFVMPPQVALTLRINGAYSQAGLLLNVTH